jgi:hypothetical protein
MLDTSGRVGRGQLISSSIQKPNQPSVFYCEECFSNEFAWLLCFGSYPGYKCTLDYLYGIGVRTIVTLTVEPLQARPLAINHVPMNHDTETQWIADSDITAEDLARFELVHIPIADRQRPTDENAQRLLQFARGFVERNSEKVGLFSEERWPRQWVYFHCWGGKGRTLTAVMYLMMQLYEKSHNDAYGWLYHRVGPHNLHKRSDSQFHFLDGLAPSKAEEELMEPVVKTPLTHPCYAVTSCSSDDV